MMTITDRDPGDEQPPTMDPIVHELVECLREAGMLLVSFDYSDTWRKQITRYRKALWAAERALKLHNEAIERGEPIVKEAE